MSTTQSPQPNSTDINSSPHQNSPSLPDAILDAISKYTDKRKKPKRNRSAFILFSIDVRKKSQYKDLDELNPNDKFVKIAQLWKEISEEERKFYEKKAKQEKDRYTTELNDFCRIYPTEPIQRPRNHIKKPCNAYGYFLKDMKEIIRKENPELRMCEVLRIVGEKWKTINPVEKEKYEKKAEISRKNFKIQVSNQIQQNKKAKLSTEKTSSPPHSKAKSPVEQRAQHKHHEEAAHRENMEAEETKDSGIIYCEPVLKRATSTDKKNVLTNSIRQANNRSSQDFNSTESIFSNSTTFQPESPNTMFSIPTFQPEIISEASSLGMSFALENLYWKVEGLRQQILMQLRNMASGGQPQTIYFGGSPIFHVRSQESPYDQINNLLFRNEPATKKEES